MRHRNTPHIAATITRYFRNILLLYIIYMVCRIIFVAANWRTFGSDFNDLSLWQLLKGSLLFDTSAILYTNLLYTILMLIPLHYKEHRKWQLTAKWIFVIVNGLAIAANLADVVYFAYTGHRTTASVTSEFSNEGNLMSIFFQAMLQNWHMVIAGAVMIWLLARKKADRGIPNLRQSLKRYYVVHTAVFLLFLPLCIGGMRGGMTKAVRPITISNANQYVNHPIETAIVLNTPFSIIRTIGKNAFKDPAYFTAEELDNLYSPIHGKPSNGGLNAQKLARKKNVVILIVESFGKEYIGTLNGNLDDGRYKGYTPFIDQLLKQSLTFDLSFANGRKSIDGMPSILSSIPHFVEPFFLTPASLNDVSGIAGELKACGYSTAFFHGAENGSMGFEAFSRTTGYQHYYGRTEYNADKRFSGDRDFDGTWAIWDEPFLQFYAQKMTEMKQPFVTTVFTASSHHPYAIPESFRSELEASGTGYASTLNDQNPIHKCIVYTDQALRRFFETARKQPWYRNTLFVITADHTNSLDHPEYATDLGLFSVPIIFFDPSGEMPRGKRHCIAQQTDIMPTLLSWLGYRKPYVAFGSDLLKTADEDTWAVNYLGGIYQFVKDSYLLQFDGKQSVGLYDISNDWLLRKNLVLSPEHSAVRVGMEQQLKAVIQSYMQRMINNELVVRDK